MKKAIVVSLLLVISCVIITGCTSFFSSGSVTGFSSSQHGTVMNARFKSFNGVRGARFKLSQGDIVRIKYELNCEDGSLTLTFEKKDGSILFSTTDTVGTEEISVDSNERYTIRLTGQKARGSYNLSWTVNP